MEFLFENPFILIVLIGIISSLFKKAKGEDPKSKRTEQKNTEPKPFVESIPIPDFFDEDILTNKPLQKSETSIDTQITMHEKVADNKKQAEIKMADGKEQQTKKPELMDSISRLNQPRKVVDKKEGRVFSVNEEKLVDAVIWSEILGPPRAKKPHRQIR